MSEILAGGRAIPAAWRGLPGVARYALNPLASRLISPEWWGLSGLPPDALQPVPVLLSRPPYLAPGAIWLRPNGRLRRAPGAVDPEGELG